MSLENKYLGNGDYFVIIASSSYLLLLTEHVANGLVEAPLKWILRMTDLLLCVHVVVKTLNFEISRCHLADYVKELHQSVCRTCSTITFPYSANHIIAFWRDRSYNGYSALCNRELKQTRRRRKWERHLKMWLRVSQLFKLVMLENVF